MKLQFPHINTAALLLSSLAFVMPAIADNHSHFATEAAKPGVVLAVGFRTDAEIDRHSSNGSNDLVSYSAAEDAAAALVYAGNNDLGAQVRPGWSPALFTQDGDELWLQFEVKWPAEWAADDLGGINTYKAFQLADGGLKQTDPGYYYGSGKLKFEIRSGFSSTDSTAVGIIDFRTYQGPSTDGANSGAIRYCLSERYCSPNQGDFDYDTQPGGDSWVDSYGNTLSGSDHLKEFPTEYQNRQSDINPFLWMPDSWTRVTLGWTRASGVERVTIWAQNESTGPVKILADPRDSSRGYKVDYPDSEGFNQFWFEFNSSQEDRTAEDWYIYFRNFIVSTQPITIDADYSPETTPSPPENLRTQ